jgi:hypothetical protein
MHPEFARRLLAMYLLHPYSITSGYRSSDEQAELWRRYQNGTGNPANPPGGSNHEAVPYGPPAGLAADLWPLDGDRAALRDAGTQVGILFPIYSYEPWHAQPVEVTSAAWSHMPFALAA